MKMDMYAHLQGSTVSRLLMLLADGEYHSGTQLGKQLNISRAAVCRAVNKVRDLGLEVAAVPAQGYKLTETFQPLDFHTISAEFTSASLGLHIMFAVGSTNTEAMGLHISPYCCADVVVAECQSAGKGRVGRRWISPLGGIYMSVVRDTGSLSGVPTSLPVASAVTIASVLDSSGVNVSLKWPNDILVDGYKVGGILTEMRGEPTGPCRIVIGVGINVSREAIKGVELDLEQELAPLPAGTIKGLDRSWIIGRLANALTEVLKGFERGEEETALDGWDYFDYFHRQNIEVHTSNSVIKGKACGVDEQGRLVLWNNDGEHRFISGEARLRQSH